LSSLANVYPDLTEEERKWLGLMKQWSSNTVYAVLLEIFYFPERRNSRGKDRLFVGPKHPSYDFFKGLYEAEADDVSCCLKMIGS
jgi:hypothetical protein